MKKYNVFEKLVTMNFGNFSFKKKERKIEYLFKTTSRMCEIEAIKTKYFKYVSLFPGGDVLPVLSLCSSAGPTERNQSSSDYSGRLEKIPAEERPAAL